MELLFLLLGTSLFLSVQPTEIDRNTYCESCLAVAQEIATAIKETPPEKRQTVVDKLLSSGLCKKVTSSKNDHTTNDKLMSSYSQADQFRAALVNEEPINLDVVLCYEQSTACVGVKRQSFEDSRATFTDSDLEALIQKNKDNLRITRPVQSDTLIRSRDEL